MHSPRERVGDSPVDHHADAVVDAFVDSFHYFDAGGRPLDRWLKRLIEELEGARKELLEQLTSTREKGYQRNLARVVKRLENVLAQLYEEQLYH
jgi:hypothetical protein